MPTLLILVAALGQNAPARPHTLAGFRLQDFHWASYSLDDVRDRKLVVLAFLGVECPLANQYAPRLVELARSFEPKGVAFFAIDANQQDGPTALGRFANAYDLPFPFLKDVGNDLADRLEVSRTPEVLVLDAKRAIRYRGRIDDQFAIGVRRTAPTRRDLAIALEELLAGNDVSVAKTDPVGCRIGRMRHPGKGEVTYALMPHMHLRGKSFRFEMTYPDGRREVLLDVPRYEFDWQNAYILDDPKPMPEGTIMRCLAHFDNSAGNPNNPDPTRVTSTNTYTMATNTAMIQPTGARRASSTIAF